VTCFNYVLADQLDLRLTTAAAAAMYWLTFFIFELAHLLQK
jgi:hypothetical protein